MRTYYIAFMAESGEWDIIKEFEAANNADAEQYAESNYSDDEWYVLDDQQNNINA